MDRKITQLQQADELTLADIIAVVQPGDTTQSLQGSTKFATLQQLLGLIKANSNPAIENSYLTIAAMLADQASQTSGNIQYVSNASADPTVSAGYAYYEYLGSTNGNLSDYRKLSKQESDVLTDFTPTGGYTGTAQDIVDSIPTDLAIELLDENDMASNSATKAPTQRSVKAYVDANAGVGTSKISVQTEITANITISGTQKGLNNLYPVSSGDDVAITVNKGTYAIGDVINFKRLGSGGVSFLRGTDVRLEGYRSTDNVHRIKNKGNLASVIFDRLDGSMLVGSVVGDIDSGSIGAVRGTIYTPLREGDVATDVAVSGNGFSANMIVTVSANATQTSSFTFINSRNIILHLTAVGVESDTVLVTYDNGDVVTDTIIIEAYQATTYADYKAWFKLDEASGVSVVDQSGDFSGTNNGTISVNNTGKVAKSYKFNGTDNYISGLASLGITGFPFTLKFWIKSANYTGSKWIMSFDSVTSYNGFNVYCSGQKLSVLFGDGVNAAQQSRRTWTSTNDILTNGTWQQIVIRVTNINTVSIAINSVNVPVSSGGGTASIMVIGSSNLEIGRSARLPEYAAFELDELTSWNRLITDTEVSDIYALENAGNSML